jgi:hypothetical protein
MRDQIRGLLTAKPASGERGKYRRIIGRTGSARNRQGAGYPYQSEAIGVAPSQISEQVEALRAGGCTMDFDPDTGAAIVTSERQFQQAARIMGLRTGRDGYENMQSGRSQARGRAEIRRHVDKWAETGDCPAEIANYFR